MSERSDLYHSTYSHFNEHVLEAVRKETFGLDIGQNSWVTVDEYDHFVPWLGLTAESHLLEVATGSGGPALYLAKRTACRVTGVDANEEGVTTASQMARPIRVAEYASG
jgi:methylase of polypeptide subunit release factors